MKKELIKEILNKYENDKIKAYKTIKANENILNNCVEDLYNIDKKIAISTLYDIVEYMLHNENIFDYDIECIYTDNDILKCECCAEYYYIEDIWYLENYEVDVCNNCLDTYYVQCDCCNKYVHEDDIRRTSDNYELCDDCYYSETYRCEECDNVYYEEDNVIYDDDNDCYYCEDCYNKLRTKCVCDYHTSKRRKDYTFLTLNDKEKYMLRELLTYGFELEVENKSNYSNYEILDDINIKDNYNIITSIEHDTSLYDGFELISNPFTKNYLIKNKDKLKELFNELKNHKLVSHDTETCGLHFHIGNLNDKAKANIIYFFEKNYDIIYKFSRRKQNSYCAKNDLKLKSNKKRKNLKEIEKQQKDLYSHNYAIVNDLETRTLEIRIFKGTINFDTFLANFIFITSLCEIAQRSKNITMRRIVKNVKDIDLQQLLILKLKERGVEVCV